MTRAIRCPRLREELISRADAVRSGRGDEEAAVRWLVCHVAVHGWPVRRLVGEDGAAAALWLASRAPLPYRACWVAKVNDAMDTGSVPQGPAHDFIQRVTAERLGR